MDSFILFILRFVLLLFLTGALGICIGLFLDRIGAKITPVFIIGMTLAMSVYAYFGWYVPIEDAASALGIVAGVAASFTFVMQIAKSWN